MGRGLEIPEFGSCDAELAAAALPMSASKEVSDPRTLEVQHGTRTNNFEHDRVSDATTITMPTRTSTSEMRVAVHVNSGNASPSGTCFG